MAAIQENEIVMFIIGLSVLLFILKNHLDPEGHANLMGFPSYNLFIHSYIILLFGWGFTILESIIWEEMFNTLEHGCYAASVIMLVLWAWKVFIIGEETE